MERHPLEQEVYEEHKNKLDAYKQVCFLMEKIDKEIFDLAIKKAAGNNMMVDYMSKNTVMGKPTLKNKK